MPHYYTGLPADEITSSSPQNKMAASTVISRLVIYASHTITFDGEAVSPLFLVFHRHSTSSYACNLPIDSGIE